MTGPESQERRSVLGGLTVMCLQSRWMILTESLAQLNQEQKTGLTMVRVIDAKKQIVAGTKYHLSAGLG